jgi:hypothetical protein
MQKGDAGNVIEARNIQQTGIQPLFAASRELG